MICDFESELMFLRLLENDSETFEANWSSLYDDATCPPISKASGVLFALLYLWLFLLGAVGNIAAIRFTTSRPVSPPIAICIRVLCASDLIHLFACLPDLCDLCLESSNLTSPVQVASKFSCSAMRYLQVSAVYVAVNVQVYLCIERYLTTCHPLKTFVMNMRRLTIISLIAAVIVALLFAIPAYTNNTLVEGHCRSKEFPFQQVYKFVEFLLFYLIPVFVFSIMYSKTVYVLWKSTTQSEQGSRVHRRSQPGQKRMAVIKSLIACVVMYIVCYSPIQYIFFASLIPNTFAYPNLFLAMVFIAMTYFSAAVNPLIYFIFIPAFRRMVFQLFCSCRMRRMGAGTLSRTDITTRFDGRSYRSLEMKGLRRDFELVQLQPVNGEVETISKDIGGG